MHAGDAAVVFAALGQIRAPGIVDAGHQTSGLERRQRRLIGAVAGLRVIRVQTVLHALEQDGRSAIARPRKCPAVYILAGENTLAGRFVKPARHFKPNRTDGNSCSSTLRGGKRRCNDASR